MKQTTVTVTPEIAEALAAQVGKGDFDSVDEAACAMLAQTLFSGDAEDDLAWARPLVDEALEEVKRGEFITLEQLHEDINDFLAMRPVRA